MSIERTNRATAAALGFLIVSVIFAVLAVAVKLTLNAPAIDAPTSSEAPACKPRANAPVWSLLPSLDHCDWTCANTARATAGARERAPTRRPARYPCALATSLRLPRGVASSRAATSSSASSDSGEVTTST